MRSWCPAQTSTAPRFSSTEKEGLTAQNWPTVTTVIARILCDPRPELPTCHPHTTTGNHEHVVREINSAWRTAHLTGHPAIDAVAKSTGCAPPDHRPHRGGEPPRAMPKGARRRSVRTCGGLDPDELAQPSPLTAPNPALPADRALLPRPGARRKRHIKRGWRPQDWRTNRSFSLGLFKEVKRAITRDRLELLQCR